MLSLDFKGRKHRLNVVQIERICDILVKEWLPYFTQGIEWHGQFLKNNIFYINEIKMNDREENYALADKAMKPFIGQPLNHDLVKLIHANVMGIKEPLGYRKGFGAPPIQNQLTGKTGYFPPNSGVYFMEKEMQKLFDWYNQGFSPVEKATRFHCGIVKIHPFDDGNGRTARLSVVLILRSHGYDEATCRAFEEYCESHRKEYDYSLSGGVNNWHGFKKTIENPVLLSSVQNFLECALERG